MLRRENLYASSALYFLAGSIWLYRGSVGDFIKEIHTSIPHPPLPSKWQHWSAIDLNNKITEGRLKSTPPSVTLKLWITSPGLHS